MEHFIAILIIALGAVVLFPVATKFREGERKAIWLCFGAHVTMAYAQILVTIHIFGGGDILNYETRGYVISELLRQDFAAYFPEVVALFLQEEYVNLPGQMFAGTSTGSQTAITGLLLYITLDSFWAASVLISLFVCASQLAIYLALRQEIHPRYHRRLQLAVLLVPSVLFWSSGMQKEAVALAGLGWVVLASLRFAYGKMTIWHLIAGIFGGIMVAYSKAYILIALVPAAAAAFYWRRSQATPGDNALVTKPFYLIVAIAVGLVGFLALGEAFPRFSIQTFAEEAAAHQYHGQQVAGGSNYIMGDPTERSLSGQLLFAPMAVATALLRPFIFEAHNAVALVNALETTAILFAFIAIFRARTLRQNIAMVMNSPVVMYCLVFTLIMSVGVGLTSTNLGTLSRYRMPMMPFYIAILALMVPLKYAPGNKQSG